MHVIEKDQGAKNSKEENVKLSQAYIVALVHIQVRVHVPLVSAVDGAGHAGP